MNPAHSSTSNTPTPPTSTNNTSYAASITSPSPSPVELVKNNPGKVVAGTGATVAAIKAYDSHEVATKNANENTRANGLIKQKIYKKLVKNSSFSEENAINELHLQGIPKKEIIEVLKLAHRLDENQIYDLKNGKLSIIATRTKGDLVKSSAKGNENLEVFNNVQEEANLVKTNLDKLNSNLSPEEKEACSLNMAELSSNAEKTGDIVKKGQNVMVNSIQDETPASPEKIEAANLLADELTIMLKQGHKELTSTLESFEKEKAAFKKPRKGSSRSSMGCLSEIFYSKYNQQEPHCTVGEPIPVSKPTTPRFGTRNAFIFLGLLFSSCFYLFGSYQKEQKEFEEIKNLIKSNPLLEILVNYKSKKTNLEETKSLLLDNFLLSDQAIHELLKKF